MTITAAFVKELRERTGAGMMDCKKALAETNANLEAAIDLMRASGAAKAAKKAGRVASEGLVNVAISDDNKNAVILEINSETDFVSKGQPFIDFVNDRFTIYIAWVDNWINFYLPQNSGYSCRWFHNCHFITASYRWLYYFFYWISWSVHSSNL